MENTTNPTNPAGYAVSNGSVAATAENNDGFPPITGRRDRIRIFTDRTEAEQMAKRLNATPNVRGGFRVVEL